MDEKPFSVLALFWSIHLDALFLRWNQCVPYIHSRISPGLCAPSPAPFHVVLFKGMPFLKPISTCP